MKGGQAAKWVDKGMPNYFLAEEQQYVKQHSKEPFSCITIYSSHTLVLQLLLEY
jgi:hypothetical protein